jgi:hypothetical protein
MMHKIMLSLKFGENLQKKGYYTMPTLYKPGPASHGCVYTTESTSQGPELHLDMSTPQG